MAIGFSLFALYIIVFGYWAGRIFFGDAELKILLGIYVALCFIIGGESVLLIINSFVSYYVFFPYVFLPLFLLIWKLRFTKLNVESRALVQHAKRSFNIKNVFSENLVTFLLGLSLAGSLYALITSRTGAPIFSILEVVPSYFWIFLASSVILTAIGCVISFTSHSNQKWLIIPVIIVAFIVYGGYFMVCAHGWDADPYGWTVAIKLVFERGYRGAPGQIMISERGTEAIIASICKLSGPKFDLYTSKTLFDLLNPLLAAIFIPLFTYQFLRKLNQDSKISLCILGALSFMFFPTFFDFAVTNSNYLGGIFLYGTLFFVFTWVEAGKTTKNVLVLLVISFIATATIHLITGIYAIMAILLAITVKSFGQRSSMRLRIRAFREKSLPLNTAVCGAAILVVSAMPIVSLLRGNDVIGYFSKTSLQPMATLKNSLSINDFLNFIAPPWLQNPITASHIIGEGYNFIRLGIIVAGFYQLFRGTSLKMSRLWISFTISSYFVAWFSIIAFTLRLDHDPYRFAFVLDLGLLPIAGLLVHDLFQKFFSGIFNMQDKKETSQYA
jgi:hypothetical protein